MKICVYCSSSDVAERYSEPVLELGKRIADGGHTLIWGGSDRGMMRLIADSVQNNGGKIIGVSFEHLKERTRKEATEMIIEKDLSTRKATMLAKADAIVMLVGGIGTLDEITEILALKNFELHGKAVVALSTDNFYESLRMQLKKMEDEGFLHRPLSDLIHFADTPAAVMAYIESYTALQKRGGY